MIFFANPPVLSRHRLPRFYRLSLTSLWLMPTCLLALSVIIGHGLSPALADPRLWLPLLLMALPAVYVWREGIDVLPYGIMRRVHWPHYFPYRHLNRWHLDHRGDSRLLTVWDQNQRKVIECYADHLSDLPLLVQSLADNLDGRRWPD
jgi:hypothetical protein